MKETPATIADERPAHRTGRLDPWLRTHTYAPLRLPARWRHPLIGYAAGTLLAGGALVPAYFLSAAFPGFDFPSALSYLVIVGVALIWGIGSGLCASLISALGINYFILAPHLAWNLSAVTDLAGFIVSFATFGAISAIASLAEGRRRQLVMRQERLEALQAVTAALAAVSTPEEVAAVMRREGARALGARSAIAWLLSPDGAWLEWAGAPPLQRIAFAAHRPACEAIRHRAPIWLESPSRPEPDPEGEAGVGDYASAAYLPLLAEGRAIGVLAVLFAQPRIFTLNERTFLHTMAGLASQAMERARQYLLVREHARASEELATLRSDLVAAVSHELRTPLTAILGLAELLQEHWDRMGEPRKRERIAQIAQAANRQSRLVEDLLLLSRLDSEAMQFNPRPIALHALVERAAAEVRASYPGQQVTLAGPADQEVFADHDRVIQILANLIDNAAKYSPEGSPVAVSWRLDGALVLVRVRDHGPGIAEQHRALLFTRFGRVPGSRIRAGHVGTGLGLYLSRRLAEAMGGRIQLEATGPEGSTFQFWLPALAAERVAAE